MAWALLVCVLSVASLSGPSRKRGADTLDINRFLASLAWRAQAYR